MMKKVVLEKSTNTHSTNSDVEVVKELENMTTVVLNVKDEKMVVEHGHHATVATDPGTKDVIKITQQEVNPITRKLMNAYD
jgi:hypothetical protein